MTFFIKNCANIVLFLSLSFSHYKCNINRQESPIHTNLVLQKMTPIKVPEPSGLAMSFDCNYLWTISDEDSKVYKIDKQGKVIRFFTVNGEDLEGITVIDSTRLAVILERSREVVVIDTLGKELKRKRFDLKGKLNEGLEGICFDTNKKDFYFVNEKLPGLLIKTDSNFAEIFKKELKIAKDYSDISFAEDDSTLWLLSDESKKIIQTDLSGKKIIEYSINVEQPEGLAVDYKNKKVFVVCDKKEELYEFNLP